MSFLSFLKGFFSGEKGSLVNIDFSKKIIIKENTLSWGGNIINEPEKISQFFKEIKKYKNEESLPFQLIHKDLEKSYEDYEKISKEKSKSLILLKDVLPLEEVECILMARRIQMAFNEKDDKLAQELYRQLEKHYPRKGRKVANLIKAGYFDELIIPMIDVFKSKYQEEYRKKFKEFYQGLLKFFPTAIFVNTHISEERLKREIKKRLRFRGIPFIKIHSIGMENIKKVERVLEDFKNDKKFRIKDERHTTSTGLQAQDLELIIEKQ